MDPTHFFLRDPGNSTEVLAAARNAPLALRNQKLTCVIALRLSRERRILEASTCHRRGKMKLGRRA